MKRSFAYFALLSSCFPACFSPNEPSAVEDTEPGTAGAGPTTSATMGPSTETDPGSTSTNPTASTSTTPPGEDDSSGTDSGPVDTTEGADCATEDDCNGSLLCVEGSCRPCTAATDPDAACEAADPDLPACDPVSGDCVVCTAQTVCPDETPACDPAVGCVACTEHHQCPDSACHLAGPDEGTCFDTADVVDVTTSEELAAAFDNIGPGEQRVLRLGDGSFDSPLGLFGAGINAQREIAILGTGDSTMLGFVDVENAIAYIAMLELGNDDPGALGDSALVNVADEGTLWMDDTNFIGSINATGDLVFRRSNLESTSGLSPFGAWIVGSGGGGIFRAENTTFGPTPETALFLADLTVEFTYVTVAGVGTAVSCNGTTGQIRNSIILGNADPAISPECDSIAWSDNAVNEAGFGMQVQPYNPQWFVSNDTSRFLLSDAGTDIFGGLAEWRDGDPLYDVQGDARPTDKPGYVGVDEP